MTEEDKALEADIAAAKPAETPAAASAEQKPAEAAESKMVPIQALDEARHQLRELRDADRQKGEKIAAMNARFEEAMKRFQAQNQPKAPEYEQDPLGHLKHETGDVRAKLAEFEKWQKEQSERAEFETKEREFRDKYVAVAQEYIKTQKDFPAAYTHLRESWASQLSALGFTPEETAQQLLMMERNIAQKAMAAGANPAERMYKAAQALGYKQTVPNATQKMETLKKGAAAAKSLSNAGGEVEPPTTLEALAELEGAEFDKMFEKIVNGGRKSGGIAGLLPN